jgi:hypothetical protein
VLPLQTPIYKVEQELCMTNTISIKQLVNAQVLSVGDKVYYAPNSSLDESKVRTGMTLTNIIDGHRYRK